MENYYCFTLRQVSMLSNVSVLCNITYYSVDQKYLSFVQKLYQCLNTYSEDYLWSSQQDQIMLYVAFSYVVRGTVKSKPLGDVEILSSAQQEHIQLFKVYFFLHVLFPTFITFHNVTFNQWNLPCKLQVMSKDIIQVDSVKHLRKLRFLSFYSGNSHMHVAIFMTSLIFEVLRKCNFLHIQLVLLCSNLQGRKSKFLLDCQNAGFKNKTHQFYLFTY